MRIIQKKKLKAFICCVYLPADDATFPHGHRQDRRKNAHHMGVILYLTLKYCAHYCYISSYRWGCHFTRSFEPCESLAVYRVKAVTKLLSYVIIECTGPALGIKPTTSLSAVNCSTDWANLAASFSCRTQVHQGCIIMKETGVTATQEFHTEKNLASLDKYSRVSGHLLLEIFLLLSHFLSFTGMR